MTIPKPRIKNGKKPSNVILEGILLKTDPSKNEYSTYPYPELMDWYPLDVFEDFFLTQRPMIEHERLRHSGHQFFILRRKTAGGKTREIILSILNDTGADSSFALAIGHNRGLVEELKEKFSKYKTLLKDPRRIVAYLKGNDSDNEEVREKVREGKDKVAVFIMTPFMLLGSFTKFSLMGWREHQEYLESFGDFEAWGEVFSSNNLGWAEKLSSPSIVFIDEVDSYPLPALLCLAMFIRFLIWKNPEIRVILSSATISNPDLFATLFFGPESEYLDLTGTGRRGKTKVEVYYEEEPKKVFDERIKAIRAKIRNDRKKMNSRRKKRYIPGKIILVLNNKRDMDRKRIIGTFSKYFVTIHGDMSSKKINKELRKFRRNPLKICLVATNIIQAGLDIPDVSWVIFYGIPQNAREYLQQRGRANRNPKQRGKIDIILRSTNPFEKRMAEPQNIEELTTFIFQEETPPFQTPLYTPLILQYAIVMGVICGFWDIRKLLKDSLYDREDPALVKAVEDAYTELLSKNIVTVGSEEIIRPTAKTKQWVYDFPRRFGSKSYKVILRTKGSKEEEIGTISLSEIFRGGLPTQTLPYIDDNYEVEEINEETQKVYVTHGFQDLFDLRNEVEKTVTVTEILYHQPGKEIAYVEVVETEKVVKKDGLIGPFESENVPLSQSTWFNGMFLKTKLTLPIENKIIKLCNTLNIERSLIKHETCYHKELGLGTLLIDSTRIGLTSMLYDAWIKEENDLCVKDEETKTLQPEEVGNRFHKYVNMFNFIIGFIADLHLNGAPIIKDGKEADFRQFCRALVAPLRHVTMIIFLGDTIDRIAAKDFSIAKKQLHILYETLDAFNLLHKTIFIKGNHDYDERYFRWRKQIRVRTELRLHLHPYQDLVIIHGNNAQLEQFKDKKRITSEDIKQWRTDFKKKVEKKFVRKDDFVVSGHLHRGFCDRDNHSLGVPSVRNYWQSSSKNEYGWVGLFCYGTLDDYWEPLIAIEDPYTP